ncbi:hypothetical protein [Brevundimonas sp. FT23042]|uniref:hypothetical protein n=1 Tax=Brevundimonas sp. FT23042 TaxID=3393749 RepID=UPI003B5898F4
MLNFEKKDNPMVIHLPLGVGYEDETGVNTFEKIRIDFFEEQGQDVFGVCIDDLLYIGYDFKLTDDMSKAAMFGRFKKNKKGVVVKEYDSIIARAMEVCTAISHGLIKIGEINSVKD